MLVFTEGEPASLAREAGADFVGSDDLIKQIEGGWTDFDVAIATREMMGKVGRLGRVLGPRGLMPNPRSGTVVAGEDIAKTVQDAKQGRVEFRLDRLANIHVPLGKVSFEEDKIRAEHGDADRSRERRQAPRNQGPVHPQRHPHDDDGPRHPPGSRVHARHARGVTTRLTR